MTVNQSLYYRKTWPSSLPPQTKTHKGTYPQMGSFAYYKMPKCTYGPQLSTVPLSTKPYDFRNVSITELCLFISFYHRSKYTKHFTRLMNHTQEPVALKFLLDHSLSNPLLLNARDTSCISAHLPIQRMPAGLALCFPPHNSQAAIMQNNSSVPSSTSNLYSITCRSF